MALSVRDIVAKLRVVFDKRSADDAEAKTKTSLNRMGDVAKKVGGIIATAFAVRQILQFARASVEAAAEAERVWSNLVGTLRNLGAASDANLAKFKAAGQAFKDATVYDDDDFYKAAQRFISITGNHTEALNAVALAANVAARYHDGALEPAIDAVSAAFNGQTRALRPYIGAVEDVNEGLKILAERSMGAAEERAQTMTGQVERLQRAWGNLKEAVGDAIIQQNNANSTIENATVAIEENTAAVATFVNGALRILTNVLKGIVFGFQEVGDALAILLVGPWALATKAAAGLARGYALVLSAGAPFSSTLREHRDNVKELAKELDELADSYLRVLASQDPRKAIGLGGGNKPAGPKPVGGVNAEGGIFVTAPDTTETADDMADPLVEAAHKARDAWDEFSDGVSRGFEEASDAANGFGAGIAAGIINGVKEAAKFKAGEQIALGTEKLAHAIWPPNPAALLSAGKHFAAAALWSALGAGAGAIAGAISGGSSGGGGSSGSVPGARDIGSQGASNAGGPVRITRIYIDGIDPQNPRHQELSAEAIRIAQERGELYEIIPSSTGRRGAA